MDEETMTKAEKGTAKILKKLISEEILAVQLYSGALQNVKSECRGAIFEKFTEIMEDERDDHLASLSRFAVGMEVEVPYRDKDVEKFASKKMFRIVDTLKNGQDAAYYIEKAIESEVEAIASFEDAMQQEYVFELNGLLLKCYYDEIQHLQELQLLLQCVTLGVELK